MIQMRLCAACLSTKQFCRQKGVVLQQMTKQVNCRRLRAPASGRALVRPEETSRAQASQKRIWQLVANQNTGTNTRTQCCQERERARILRHAPDCHKEDGAWPWREYKAFIIRAMPQKLRGLFTMNWCEELGARQAVTLGVRGGTQRVALNNVFERKTMRFCAKERYNDTQEKRYTRSSSRRKSFREIAQRSSTDIGHSNVEGARQEVRSCTWRIQPYRRETSCLLHSRQPFGSES